MKLVAALLILLSGCSPWVTDVYYRPHPGVASIAAATQPSQPPQVTAFASVIGIRKPDSKQNLPYLVEVRLRLDNDGADTISLDPKSLELTTGDLVRFPPPMPIAGSDLAVTSHQSLVVTADFPFPENRPFDEFNLDTLQLRWRVHVGNSDVQQSIDFHRQFYEDYYYGRPYYYGDGPYWDDGIYPYAYPVPVFRGAIIVHRR